MRLTTAFDARHMTRYLFSLINTFALCVGAVPLWAQVPPTLQETAADSGLLAAAARGDVAMAAKLIAAGAPLDHVNNLGWTALIESIVLGNGGKRHTVPLRALVQAGVNVNIADRSRVSPLRLAGSRGYREMVQILEQAGAK